MRSGDHCPAAAESARCRFECRRLGGSGLLVGDPCPNRYTRTAETHILRPYPAAGRANYFVVPRFSCPDLMPVPPQRQLHPTNPAK
jgi:hypothetical protein